MKVKVINRSEVACTRERAEDVQQVHRNLDPQLHPFDKAKEYTRAVNAAKLERIFAKPFIAALEHSEAVYSLARNPRRLNCILTGCGDGVVNLWDVAERRCNTEQCWPSTQQRCSCWHGGSVFRTAWSDVRSDCCAWHCTVCISATCNHGTLENLHTLC